MNVDNIAHDAHTGAREVRVWDLFVRAGHWALVLAFTIAWFTGEDESLLHVWSGYAIAAVVTLRLLWGFIGTRHARFRDFVRGPRAVVAYLRGLAVGKAPRYLGHNPAGGAMAIALLAALAVTTVSGMLVYAIEEGAGPLATFAVAAERPPKALVIIPAVYADDDDYEDTDEKREEFWEDMHELGANLSLALIGVHVLGVLASSLAHRENLLRGMVTGKKRAER